MTDTPYLDRLWKRGTDFLGSRYAILCGAMSWLSESNLVSAISNSGGFGVLAAANMPPEVLEEEIRKTRSKTSNNFGVNLITISPNFKSQLDVAINARMQYVFFAGSIPGGADIERMKGVGAKVVCFTPTLPLAKRFIRQGVDALILEGNEAGGHIGPVSISVLVQEILLHVDEVPVFVAGGIATGEMMAQYLSLGAAGCQLGTRFVVAEECIAHPSFKRALVKAQSRDAVPTAQFDASLPVIPVRAIRNEGTKRFNQLQLQLLREMKEGKMDREKAQLKLEEFWVGALRRGVIEGDVDEGSLMCGQGVGMVKKIQPVKEIIEELVQAAENKLREISAASINNPASGRF